MESRDSAPVIDAGLWRMFPAVRTPERGRFVVFAALAALLMAAQTLGLAGAEALLIGRRGVGALPTAFVAAALAAVAAALAYASQVGRWRNDDLFVVLLGVGAALLAAGAAAAQRALPGSEAALFAGFFVGEAVLLNHFWTFAGDHFDARASRRLFPLLTLGSSVGGVAGGAAAVALARLGAPVVLIAGWALLLAAAALLLRVARPRLRRSAPLASQEQDETSVAGLRAALRYARAAPMGRALVLSAVAMVTALFVAQYLYSRVFAERFPSAAELATFFGIFLLVGNIVEVAVELALPSLVRRVGIANANLVHPAAALASFAALGLDFRLPSAMLARGTREALKASLADPVRSLVYNALPSRLRGRMRALLEGIVVYSGMATAGAVLLALGEPDPLWLCGGGALLALFYLVANLAVRRTYLDALVEQMRSGRLDLAELGEGLGRAELQRLAALWEGLVAGPELPGTAALELAPVLAQRGLRAPLLATAHHEDARVRRAVVEALALDPDAEALGALRRALGDRDAEVRAAAVRGIAGHGDTDAMVGAALRLRLGDASPVVRAEAAAALGADGETLLARLARSPARDEACAGLARLPRSLRSAALDRTEDPDPAVRAAALDAAVRLGGADALEVGRLELALEQAALPVRLAALRALAVRGGAPACAMLAAALDDPAREVRRGAARALGECGAHGLEAARQRVDAERAETAAAALDALAAAPPERARPELIAAFRGFALRAWDHQLAVHVLDEVDRRLPGGPQAAQRAEGERSSQGLRFLAVAHRDGLARAVALAFRALAHAEGEALVKSLERALRLGAPATRAEALEVLSNLGEREAAELFTLLHEAAPIEDRIRELPRFADRPRDPKQVEAAAASSADRWVRLAAAAVTSATDEKAQEAGKEMERLLALRRVPLFAGLNLDQLEEIARLLRDEDYVAGELVVREGEPGSDLYVLLDGEVSIQRGYGTPQAVELNRLAAVACFGEMAVLADERRGASALVTRDAHLAVLSGERLKELILQAPEISFDLFRELIGRVRAAENRLDRGATPAAVAEQTR